MRLLHDDTDQFFEYGIHIPTRTLVLGAEVDWDGITTEYFLKGMALLEAKSTEPITIILNNMGGDCYHGLAIYDAIAGAKAHVTAKVYGHAMSMGGWILQAADTRLMAPNATLMIHVGRDTIDSPAALREWNRLQRIMEDTFLQRLREIKPTFTRAALLRKMEADWFVPAHEAVKLGLADRIL